MKNKYYSLIAFISAIVIGFIALFLPPSGVIHTSVLWFVAQLLVFVSNILGFNFNVFKPDSFIQSDKENQ